MRYMALRSSTRSTLTTSSLRRVPNQQQLSPCLALLRRLHTSYTWSQDQQDVPSKHPQLSTTEYLRALSQFFNRFVSSEGKEGITSIGKLRPLVLTAVNRMRLDIDRQHLALKASEKPPGLTWRPTFEDFYDEVLDQIDGPPRPSHLKDLDLVYSDLDAVNRALVTLDEAMEKKSGDSAGAEHTEGPSVQGNRKATVARKTAKVPVWETVASPDPKEQQVGEITSKQDPTSETTGDPSPLASSLVGTNTVNENDEYFIRLRRDLGVLYQKGYFKPDPALLGMLGPDNGVNNHNEPSSIIAALAGSSKSPEPAVEPSVEQTRTALAPVSSMPTVPLEPSAGLRVSAAERVNQVSPMLAGIKKWVDDLVRDSSPAFCEKMVRHRPVSFEHHEANQVVQKMSFFLEFILSDLFSTRSHHFGDNVPSEVVQILQASDHIDLSYCRHDDCGISPDYACLSLAEDLHDYAKHLQRLMNMIYDAVPDVSDPEVSKSMRGCIFRIQKNEDEIDRCMDQLRLEFFVRAAPDSLSSLDEKTPSDPLPLPACPPLPAFEDLPFDLGGIPQWINQMVSACGPEGDQGIFRDRRVDADSIPADHLMEDLECQLQAILFDLCLTRSHLFGHQIPAEVGDVLQRDWTSNMGWCSRSFCGVKPKFARMSYIDGLHKYFTRLQTLVRLIHEAVPSGLEVRNKMVGSCFRRINNAATILERRVDELEWEILERDLKRSTTSS